MVDLLTSNWILAITGAVILTILYLICCIYSTRKAIRDRNSIIERNQEKRNNKYLKEMGLDSQNIYSSSQNTKYLNNGSTGNQNGKGEWANYRNYPLTHARKVNLEDIDEIINEAISAAGSTNSSFVDKTVSETSQSHTKDSKNDKNLQEPLIIEKHKIISADVCPRVYYLKARSLERREQETPRNWVAERLNNASSFAVAQRQLQYGFKKAPLAKQNSGFSSMDEDSSAS